MRGWDLVFVFISVGLSSLSQILLKYGTTQPAFRHSFQAASALDVAIATSTSPAIVGGFFCFGLSAVFWLFVLSRISLSSAYPCIALGIVITTVAGRLIFDEPISGMKIAAIAIIVSGVLILAASS